MRGRRIDLYDSIMVVFETDGIQPQTAKLGYNLTQRIQARK